MNKIISGIKSILWWLVISIPFLLLTVMLSLLILCAEGCKI